MALSYYRMHRIYPVNTMNYGLSSYDLGKFFYYNNIRKEMADKKKETVKKVIPLNGVMLEGMDKLI